ncbi:MAG: cation transporter [Propionibacteriaceae bacterium]|nr:cation transporter [Propionibacteriaceae bacterium]
MSAPGEGSARFGDTALPREQHDALRRAIRLQWVGIAYLLSCVIVVFAVMGSSQAMKVAWVEDMLSLVPPLVFLVSLRSIRRPPTPERPYGHHRAIGSAHLASAVALFAMGAFMVFDSGSGLLTAEHPPIGTYHLFGQTVWAGWLMIGAMVYTGIGPVILGRLKKPLAETLHDKVLWSDADMNAADWRTAAAAILGILGIGVGWWWADSVAALVIAASILKDGVTGIANALRDLMDGEARTHDDARTHPLVDAVLTIARGPAWVADAAVRVRDQGHLFHVEVFVVPTATVAVAELEALAATISELDWKLHDVVVAPVSRLPDAVRAAPASG